MNYGKPRNPYHNPEAYRAIGLGNGACHIGYVSLSECVSEMEAKANAEFIVLACNAHDDLLAACKSVLGMLSSPKFLEFQTRFRQSDSEWAMVSAMEMREEEIKAAIAKAECL